MELDFLFAFLAVVCYAYLFDVPLRPTLIAGISGSLAWMMSKYWISHDIFGTAFAAFTIGVIAYLFAPRLHQPVTTMIIPAIIVLVPGAAAYNALRFAIEGNSSLAGQGVISVISSTLAIAGVLSVSELIMLRFNRSWRTFWEHRRQKKNQ